MFDTIIGIALIIMAIFLVIAVLMQSSKDHRHGVTVAGGAETFFGKNKGKSLDAMFNKLTTIVAVIFVVLVILLYVVQPEVTVPTVPVTPDAETEETVPADEEPVVEGDVVEGEVVEDEEPVAPAPEELLNGTEEAPESEVATEAESETEVEPEAEVENTEAE